MNDDKQIKTNDDKVIISNNENVETICQWKKKNSKDSK